MKQKRTLCFCRGHVAMEQNSRGRLFHCLVKSLCRSCNSAHRMTVSEQGQKEEKKRKRKEEEQLKREKQNRSERKKKVNNAMQRRMIRFKPLHV